VSDFATTEINFLSPLLIPFFVRDVYNDETAFYLVLPADFESNDSSAQIYTTSLKRGKSVSHLSVRRMKSLNEEEETIGSGMVESFTKRNGSGTDDDASVSSTGSKSIFSKVTRSIKRNPKEKQEIIYQFRVLLDGNEKFIWLQAAAELNRLAVESSVSILGAAGNVAGSAAGATK
jgi:hypothetical protein